MGFTRRFASRADSDNCLAFPEVEVVEDVPTLSARIEEKQKRLENRPRSKSKVYPQLDDPELDRAERERQGSLHAKICIFLCTVLPFVTLVATLHRLWFMGIIVFTADHECPDGWQLWSGSCYLFLAENASWSNALTACVQSDLPDTYLVDITSEEENRFLAQLSDEKFWTAGKQSKQGWKWEPGRRMVTWRKPIVTKARRRPGGGPGRGPSEAVNMPVGTLWKRLPSGARGLTVTEEADKKGNEYQAVMEEKKRVRRANTGALSVLQSVLGLVSGSSTETVDWLPPLNLTHLEDSLHEEDDDLHLDLSQTEDNLHESLDDDSRRHGLSETEYSHHQNQSPNETGLHRNSSQTVDGLDQNHRSQTEDGLHHNQSQAEDGLHINLGQTENALHENLSETEDGLREDYSLQYNEDILNIEEEVRKVLNDRPDGDTIAGPDECLLVGGGDWFSDDCSSQRYFVCKSSSVINSAKREKKICKKQQEVKMYNTKLYYKCEDD